MFVGSFIFQPLFLILLYNLYAKDSTDTDEKGVVELAKTKESLSETVSQVEPAVSPSVLNFLAEHIGFCSLIALTGFAVVVMLWLVSKHFRSAQ